MITGHSCLNQLCTGGSESWFKQKKGRSHHTRTHTISYHIIRKGSSLLGPSQQQVTNTDTDTINPVCAACLYCMLWLQHGFARSYLWLRCPV